MGKPKSPLALAMVLVILAIFLLVVLQWTMDLQRSERTLLWVVLIVGGIFAAGYALKKNLT